MCVGKKGRRGERRGGKGRGGEALQLEGMGNGVEGRREWWRGGGGGGKSG